MASSRECVIVSTDPVAPIDANRAAAPSWKRSIGGPPALKTSIPSQYTPREWPVPSAFIAASFAANLAANDDAASRRRRQ